LAQTGWILRNTKGIVIFPRKEVYNMKCKLHIHPKFETVTISTEGTTPRDEVGEFVSNCPIDDQRLRHKSERIVRNIVTEFLKQFPHIRTIAHPTGDGTTVTIPKSEYDGMKNTIAAQAARIEALEKENIELRRENAELRQQVVELQRENSELRKTVEMLIHRIEFLEAKN
jgi:cell division protein FtsB